METPTKVISFTVKDIRFPTSLEGDGSDSINDPDYSCPYVTLKTDTGLEGYGITFTIGKGNDIDVIGFTVKDIRFPTALEGDGSDAINDPDYSCAYVCLQTNTGLDGCGFTFTNGRGTDIVALAVSQFASMVVNKPLINIFSAFGEFWQQLAHDPQLRWLGPEKGVTHIAMAAVVNALWDLWAKMENKEPEQLVSVIDFRYITDALTKKEAIELLKQGRVGREEREKAFLANGYPAYTTSAGWMGYSDEKIKRLCKEALDEGFTRFKVKVGCNVTDDINRVGQVRKQIGEDNMLMVDANQRWGVQESIDWMKQLAQFNLTWIEEPTSPDDILGHAAIRKAMQPLGIGVATGESCQNRVMFKQFFQAEAFDYCQIDSCREAGPNEILAVYLMARKFNVKVCPHAGGVGLCELVQHLQAFDYIALSGSIEGRMIEYVDHLHEHFTYPVIMKGGHYQAPKATGYSSEMKTESLAAYEYPTGSAWQKLFDEGKYDRPQKM